MGYVPPRPTGMVVLPPGARYEAFTHPNLGLSGDTLDHMLSIFELQDQALGFSADRSSYRRYVRDLYGGAGRDWFPTLNLGLLACMITLPILVLAALT